MTHDNIKASNLYTYISKARLVANVEATLSEIDRKLECYDRNIKFFEELGLVGPLAVVIEEYNKLNKLRIETNLILLDIKRELFEFELATLYED
jgi:hypothetical protein